MQPYATDLAYIHDVGYGDFARQSAPHLLRILRQRGIVGGTVVDLGCGSGIWAAELLKAGCRVVGVDISPHMIALARRRAPAARLHAASFLDFEFPACRAVTALGEVLGYALDPNNHRAALRRLLRKIHQALEPGGVLIFDVADTTRHRGLRQAHAVGDDWATLVEFERDEKSHTLTRKITSFRQVGKTYRRAEETHRLHLHRPREVASWLRTAGFTARIVRGYGGYRFWPGGVGFIARKRK
ncbi:MAG: methyltransferase domain-containing protein [Pirellulaceae bacterium]